MVVVAVLVVAHGTDAAVVVVVRIFGMYFNEPNLFLLLHQWP